MWNAAGLSGMKVSIMDMSSSNITYHKAPVGPRAERPDSDTISPRALDRSRRHRRLLRPRPRQSRPAAPDRHAVPRRARLPARARLRPRPAGRRDLDPRRQRRSTRCRRRRLARAHGPHRRLRAARTASTPCRSSRTSSSSCCRPRRSPTAAGAPDPARDRVAGGALRDALLRHHRARGAFVAERVRKATPRAALLSTLAGIALELHLARLPLPHVRAPDRRPDDARRS